MATESGMVGVKDLRPYLMRMIPSARKRLAALPATRTALRADLRAIIRVIGPSLGAIYYEKDLNWQKITTETKRLTKTSETLEKPSIELGQEDAKKDD